MRASYVNENCALVRIYSLHCTKSELYAHTAAKAAIYFYSDGDNENIKARSFGLVLMKCRAFFFFMSLDRKYGRTSQRPSAAKKCRAAWTNIDHDFKNISIGNSFLVLCFYQTFVVLLISLYIEPACTCKNHAPRAKTHHAVQFKEAIIRVNCRLFVNHTLCLSVISATPRALTHFSRIHRRAVFNLNNHTRIGEPT